MSDEEENQGQSWIDEVKPEARAKTELAYEREADRAMAAVGNLQNMAEPEVDGEQQHAADLAAVLAQSVDGKRLTPRDVSRARQTGLEFARINPAQAEAWEEWASQSADRTGWLVSKLAAGELPSGPPSAHAEQLSSLGGKWSAQRELSALIAQHPPGTPGYLANQPRIQALYQYIDGDEPIVGRGLRTVR